MVRFDIGDPGVCHIGVRAAQCLLTQMDVSRKSGFCFQLLGDSTCQGDFMSMELLLF